MMRISLNIHKRNSQNGINPILSYSARGQAPEIFAKRVKTNPQKPSKYENSSVNKYTGSLPQHPNQPEWAFRIYVTAPESLGFTIERYRWHWWVGNNTYSQSEEFTSSKFATSFNDCGSGSSFIPAGTTKCADLRVSLGAPVSGKLVMIFVGKTSDNKYYRINSPVLLLN